MKLIATMKSFLLQQGVRRLWPLPAVGSKGRGTPDTTVQPPAWLVCHDSHLQQICEAEPRISWLVLLQDGLANFASFTFSMF